MELILTIARALADENRVRALMAIGEQEVCVCQLIELLGLAPSTVSKHMSILKQAKLVTGHKKGRWMYYRLPETATPFVQKVISWVRQAASEDHQILLDAEQMKRILGTDRELICQRQSIRRSKKVTNQKSFTVF